RHVLDAIHERGAGADLSLGAVRFSWTEPLRIDALAARLASGERITVRSARLGWSWAGGRDLRAHLRHVSLEGARLERGPLVVDWPAAELDVVAWQRGPGDERVHVRQSDTGGEMDARWRRAGAREASVSVSRFDVSQARVTWAGEPVLAPGAW